LVPYLFSLLLQVTSKIRKFHKEEYKVGEKEEKKRCATGHAKQRDRASGHCRKQLQPTLGRASDGQPMAGRQSRQLVAAGQLALLHVFAAGSFFLFIILT